MANLRLIFVGVLFYMCHTEGTISDKRLCADPTCSTPISHATTLIRYSSAEKHILSFPRNVDVKVFSKSAGSNKDLWGVEIKGKRGYAPKRFLRETTILAKSDKLIHTVPTELEDLTLETKTENVTSYESPSPEIETLREEIDKQTSNEESLYNPVSSIEELGSGGAALPDPKKFNVPLFVVAGVSADSVQKSTPPPEGISRPMEVVDGTTFYLDTDGSGSEDKPVIATATQLNIQPSVTLEQPSKSPESLQTLPVTSNTKLEEPKASMVLSKSVTSSDDTAKVSKDVEEQSNEDSTNSVEDNPEGSGAETVMKFLKDLISPDVSIETKNKVEESSSEEVKAVSEESDDEDEDLDDEMNGDEEEDGTEDDEDEEEEDVGSQEGNKNIDLSGEVNPPKENMQKTPVTPTPEAEVDGANYGSPLPSIPSVDINNITRSEQSETSSSIEIASNDIGSRKKDDVHVDPLVPILLMVPDAVNSIKDHTNPQSDEHKKATEEEDKVKELSQTVEKVSQGAESVLATTSDNVPEEHLEDTVVDKLSEDAVRPVVAGGLQNMVLENNIPPSEGAVNVPVIPASELQDVSSENAETNAMKQIVEPLSIVPAIQESQVEHVSPGNTEVNTTEPAVEERRGEVVRSGDENKEADANLLESSSANIVDEHKGVEESISDVPETLTFSNEDEISIKHPIKDSEEEYEELKQQIVEDPVKEYVESSQEFTTDIPGDWIPKPDVGEELVTEGYSNLEEMSQNTSVDVDTDGEAQAPVEDIEAEELPVETRGDQYSSEEQPEEQVTESSVGFISSLKNSILGLWGSSEEVPESVLAPDVGHLQEEEEKDKESRRIKERSAAWSSQWGAPAEEHMAHQEGDHLLSKTDPNAASCDTSSGACEGDTTSGELPVQPTQFPPGLGPDEQPSDNAGSGLDITMELQKTSFESVMFLVITAVTVLLFSLGHYYIEKLRRDGSLVAKITSLEKALLVSSKENFLLKDNLVETREKLSSIEDFSSDSGEALDVLQSELEESKAVRVELEDQVVSLEKELEAATEAGLELNRMLSEFLSAQHGSDTLIKSVEHLQKQLDNQQGTISTMNTSLSVKSQENEGLHTDLTIANEHIKTLEEDILKVQQSLVDVQNSKYEMEQKLMLKTRTVETQLVESLESKSAETQRLCRELDTLQEVLEEAQQKLATRDGELAALQDCLRQNDASDGQMEELLDVGRVRAELGQVMRAKETLKERLQGEEDARRLLEDHVRIVSEEVASMRTKYEEAERDKIDAQTRLEVLSNYFKEKETQLQKELGLQEAMCIQKEGDATSTYERIKSLQEESESYKSQNEILKREILDQERGLKAQIATLEKKVHENWVVARQAERRLEESKQESGQLRNRLTLAQRNLANSSQSGDTMKLNDRLTADSNGELPTSPLHMGLADLPPDSSASPLHYGHPVSPPLLPPGPGQPPLLPGAFVRMPPPGMFLPPPPSRVPFMPPPPIMPPRDRRPPPLGRMSSPPPEPRGGRYSPYDHSPPLSPLGRPYRSPPPHYDDSPERFRHRTPPPPNSQPFGMYGPPPLGAWDDHSGPPRSSFRPLHRDSPREPKGSNLSSGHSSESLEKSSRHSGRV